VCSHTEADPPVYQGVAVAAELLKAISALPANVDIVAFGAGHDQTINAVFTSPENQPAWDEEFRLHKMPSFKWDGGKWVRVGWFW
jgi:hypothetical protein